MLRVDHSGAIRQVPAESVANAPADNFARRTLMVGRAALSPTFCLARPTERRDREAKRAF